MAVSGKIIGGTSESPWIMMGIHTYMKSNNINISAWKTLDNL